MASSYRPSNTLIALIVAPLLVSILGGLIVEWLKPGDKGKDNSSDKSLPASNLTSAPSESKMSAAEPITIIGKWYYPKNDSILEFFPNGKLTMESEKGTYVTTFTPETNPMRIRLSDDPRDWGEVVSVSREELVIHWHRYHTIGSDDDYSIRYQKEKPTSPWYYVGIIALGLVGLFILICIIGAIVQQAKK